MGRMDELIGYGREHGCSDIHLTYGMEPMARCNGNLIKLSGYGSMDDAVLEEMALEILQKENMKISGDKKMMDINVCYETADGTRNRVHIYHQQKHTSIAIRLLNAHIPTLEELGAPSALKDLTGLAQGLVIVTGLSGSGKSTTLAACIDEMNRTQRRHIITIEDPVEYVHKSKSCMINQREAGVDTAGVAEALRSSLRENADVILAAELRDAEAVSAAIAAAEAGHLVFSALYAGGGSAAVEHMVNLFPLQMQQQIRRRLAAVLKAVVCQQLVPSADGSGRSADWEIFLVDEEAADKIRSDK